MPPQASWPDVSHSGFTEWWALLAKPIPLADGVWLLLAPERLRLGAVTGRDRVLTVPVSLDARPRIVTGRDTPAWATPEKTRIIHIMNVLE